MRESIIYICNEEYYWVLIQDYEYYNVPFYLYYNPVTGDDVELIALMKKSKDEKGDIINYDISLIMSLFYSKKTREILLLATENNLPIQKKYFGFISEIVKKLQLIPKYDSYPFKELCTR